VAHYLVVLSDADPSRVDRGETLVKFLRLWERHVEVVTTADLLSGPTRQAEVALVGTPSGFSAAHATRIRAAHCVTFDYFDEPAPFLAESDAEFLRQWSARHLKTHRLHPVADGLPIGLLPIRYNAAVRGAWQRHRLAVLPRLARRVAGRAERPWDVSLQGSTTFLAQSGGPGEPPQRYEQRVEWLRELRRHGEWSQWGGLVELPYRTRADVMADHGAEAGSLFTDGPRLPFGEYFRRMTRTKVALCPTGHARWTYRHVESVYAGCEVVSTELRGIETLVPAPLSAFTCVPDGAPVGPAVQVALERFEERRDRRADALAQVEQWLSGGRFSPGRVRPYEAFVDRLRRG
jgi:hypothetical protein